MTDPKPLTRKELAEFLPNQRAIRAFEELFEVVPSDLETLLAQIDDVDNTSESALSSAASAFSFAKSLDLRPKGLVFVSKLADLPKPQAGVINLLARYTYYFTGTVDLEGNRLVCGQDTTILGSSSENCRILSTGLGLGTALITSEYTLPMRHITLEAETILDLDATGNPSQALDWYGVNFANSSDIGKVENYSNFVVASMAFLGASGLVFDGTIGTIAFSNCLFVADGVGTVIEIPSTLTIERRFRIIYSSFVVNGTSTGIDFNASATVPVEGYILDTCNFSGVSTYTTGVTFSDNKARWIENRGVSNSAALTSYYMQGNATTTVITMAGVPIKVAGTTTEGSISQRFIVTTTNRATYDGEIDRNFKVAATLSLSSGNNNKIGIYIAKNGTVINESETYVTTNSAGRLENGVVQVLTNLEDSDYIEIFVENDTSATNILVEDLNVIIEAIS